MMTIYVMDTNIIIKIFDSYYKPAFPSFSEKLNASVQSGQIISTDEVYNEIKGPPEMHEWCDLNKDIFRLPENPELEFVAEILRTRDFKNLLLSRKDKLNDGPVADPFIIAKAKFITNGCVLTNESAKNKQGKKVKIPTVCKHFGIDCVDLDEFMRRESWQF